MGTEPGSAELQQVIDDLTRQNAELRRRADHRRGYRVRAVCSWVLTVLACLLAVLSVVVVFARTQLLDTDAYVATVAPLAADPAIQAQVSRQVSTALVTRSDLEHRVKDLLPSRAAPLAGPITAGVQQLTEQVTHRVVSSPKFETVWVAANRAAHERVSALLTGSGHGALASQRGTVTVDLAQVQQEVVHALDARGITFFDHLPTTSRTDVVLFHSDSLARAQRLTSLLVKVAVLLPVLGLICLAGAVALARRRRRAVVRCAAALAVTMGLVLVVLALARNQYLSGVHPPRSPAAAAAVLDIVTASLRATLRIFLVVAAAAAVVGAIIGNRWLRAWVADRRLPGWVPWRPVHACAARHRRALQGGVLGIGLLVLVVWDTPTPLVALVVALVTLAVVGVVGLAAGRGAPPAVGPPPVGPPVPPVSAAPPVPGAALLPARGPGGRRRSRPTAARPTAAQAAVPRSSPPPCRAEMNASVSS